MTVALALPYRHGAVFAADSRLTQNAAGQPVQRTARKLHAVADRMLWVGAGSSAVLDRVARIITMGLAESADPETVVGDRVAPVLEHVAGLRAADPIEAELLVAWQEGSETRIMVVPPSGLEHRLTTLPAAIGSGDIFVYSGLARLSLTWSTWLSMSQALVLAYRLIADAIDAAGVYLGHPVQLAVITEAGPCVLPDTLVRSWIAPAVQRWRADERRLFASLQLDVPR